MRTVICLGLLCSVASATDLSTGLVSHWNMDEASGNAVDVVSGNTLTDSGSVGTTTGKIAGAREFRLSHPDNLRHVDNASLSTGDIDFHLAMWVRLDSGGTYQCFVCKWSNTGSASGREYWLGVNPSRVVEAYFFRSSYTIVTATTFGALTVGQWYFVEMWHDAIHDVAGVSVNLTANTSAYSVGVNDGVVDFWVGGDDAGENLDGAVDEVSFYKRILADSEREQLYNDGAGLAYPFVIVAAYHIHQVLLFWMVVEGFEYGFWLQRAKGQIV